MFRRLLPVVIGFVLIVALAFAGRPAAAQDAFSFGGLTDIDAPKVVGIRGSATLVRGGATLAISKGKILTDGDVISTGDGGVVVVAYLTDSRLVIWPASRIQLTFTGRTARTQKAFDYKHLSGKVYNRIGGSYFGRTDINVALPTGTAHAESAEFITYASGGASVSVRTGSVQLTGNGFSKEVATGKKMNAYGGTPVALGEGAIDDFMHSGQYVVMAERGDNYGSPSYTAPAAADVQAGMSESGKPFKSSSDIVFTSAFTDNEAQAADLSAGAGSLTTSMPPGKKGKNITTSDRAMGGELPYFPPDRIGAARNPDKDYGIYKPVPVKDGIVPGDTTDADLWPELYDETDSEFLTDADPLYPFPPAGAKTKPTPKTRKKAESMRSVSPPPITNITQRKTTDPMPDYKGAYSMCQNYESTQSEVDDCIMKNVKPEKAPGAIEFPQPPPELNLPMSHEPKVPEYVSLPPVSELPPPNRTLSTGPSLPTCRYSLLANYSLSGNDRGLELLNQSRFASALEMFEDALRTNPESADILNNIAITYLRMGAPDKAERFMKRALAAEPGRLDVHNNIGCVFFSLGKSMQACNEWAMILKQKEDAKDAVANKLNFCRQ